VIEQTKLRRRRFSLDRRGLIQYPEMLQFGCHVTEAKFLGFEESCMAKLQENALP